MTARSELSRAHLAAVIDRWQADEQCRWLPVAGDSMWPHLRHGDDVLVRFSSAAPHVGDVALLWPDTPDDAPLLLHRVIRIGSSGATVTTQGDNRRSPDPSHPRVAVRGTVIARRRATAVHRYDRSRTRAVAAGYAWAVRLSILPIVLRVATCCLRRHKILITQGATQHA